MDTKAKVSVVQCGTQFGDMSKTLQDLERWVKEAQLQGSKLAVFPEA